jgi:ATP-dependent DNA ligase
MPVGFARADILRVQSGEYYVSEKTDGVRYFLVVAGGTAALIDRSNMPFTAPGMNLLNMVLPEGTVLDGELVVRVSVALAFLGDHDVLICG